MTAKLTIKQARFCDEYLKDGNGSRAYRTAYDAQRMSDDAVGVEACRLLRHPKVARAVADARQRMARKAEITQDTIVEMLLEDRQFAIEQKAASAAQAATMGLAKVLGHLTEERRNNRSPLEDWPLDRLQELQRALDAADAEPDCSPPTKH